MMNIIVILLIFIILALAINKIIIEKRKGSKCIGCPYNQSECNNYKYKKN